MTELQLETPNGTVRALLFAPEGEGPFPGVVVVHDALGLSPDIEENARMIAARGYLVMVPDLYSRGGRVRCVTRVMKELAMQQGRALDDILAAREALMTREDCTGAVGIVGFCMGGGFAIVLASAGFDASAPFYGVVPRHLDQALEGSCPMVASLGKRDPVPVMIGVEKRLRAGLEKRGVDHDVKLYPGVGHSFANRIDLGPFTPLLKVTGFHYGEEATADAWRRVFAFFDKHLKV
jgi:carboxymethylenebutenolidase